jgi:hypothetical protein
MLLIEILEKSEGTLQEKEKQLISGRLLSFISYKTFVRTPTDPSKLKRRGGRALGSAIPPSYR